jgi:hypothetical protein
MASYSLDAKSQEDSEARSSPGKNRRFNHLSCVYAPLSMLLLLQLTIFSRKRRTFSAGEFDRRVAPSRTPQFWRGLSPPTCGLLLLDERPKAKLMRTEQGPRIVLVDDKGRGPTARMLSAVINAKLSVASATPPIFEIISQEQSQYIRETFDPSDTTVFVTVSERTLSYRDDSPQATRVACKSLEVAQALTRLDTRFRVFLIRQAGVADFTGVDTAAALIAGVAGLVDDRLLMTEGMLDMVLGHSHCDLHGRTMLIVGEPAARLRKIREMLGEWALIEEGSDAIDLNCFRAALALAQLDRLQPLRGPGYPYSFVKIAHALNLAKPITSFHLTQGDLRKTLSTLADRLLGSDREHFERLRLPDYARHWEFPSNLPVVEGVPETEIGKRLYIACSSVEIEPRGSSGGVDLWAARLSTTEIRNSSSPSNAS